MTEIISQQYRDEIARLKLDPRIQAMADEIFGDPVGEIPSPDSWSFTSAASDEYRRRGGEAFSIGGPAKAIIALLEDRHASAQEARARTQ